jgi:kynurenine--oxoglutarate transaminase/cysteine-S-conjugate beta-lyase/glutamine--phenylpyruvate transaminase
VSSSYHQYTRPSGHPPLVSTLASAYSIHLDRYIDSLNEVVITVGASQALYLCMQTLLQPGDEVIVFEPYFDLYVRQLKLMPGVSPVYVQLGGDAATLSDPWALDIEALKR